VEAPPHTSAPSLTGRSVPPTPQGVQEAWGEWIAGRWSWEWFATLTFAPLGDSRQVVHDQVGWSAGDRHYREWIDSLEQTYSVSGDRMRPVSSTGLWWVRAREPHQFRNATHFHALIGGVGNLTRKEAWQLWYRKHGMARIEPIREIGGPGIVGGVAFYVAKYINKTGGELVFSDNAHEYMREEPTDE
jgi:hypothetical protein